MKAPRLYNCLCDETRLRILNLLLEGPLCVCHFSAVLGVPQPKVSRHLKILKQGGALETERCYNWTICRLPENPGPLLQANLECLQDLRSEERQFRADLQKRKRVVAALRTCGDDTLPEPIRSLSEARGVQ